MTTNATIITKNQHQQGGAQWDVAGALNINAGGVLTIEPGGQIVGVGSIPFNVRIRATAAQINAGLTLIAAVAGLKARVSSARMIAVGGAAAGATSVDILATQGAASVKLMSAAVAALTQSTLVAENTANVTILADGGSFVQNDVNTAITIGKTGGALTGATAIDVLLTFVLE